jgi:hypothetical protein
MRFGRQRKNNGLGERTFHFNSDSPSNTKSRALPTEAGDKPPRHRSQLSLFMCSTTRMIPALRNLGQRVRRCEVRQTASISGGNLNSGFVLRGIANSCLQTKVKLERNRNSYRLTVLPDGGLAFPCLHCLHDRLIQTQTGCFHNVDVFNSSIYRDSAFRLDSSLKSRSPCFICALWRRHVVTRWWAYFTLVRRCISTVRTRRRLWRLGWRECRKTYGHNRRDTD